MKIVSCRSVRYARREVDTGFPAAWGLLRLSAKSYVKKYFSLTLAPFAEFTLRHELRCTSSLSESLFYIRFTNLRL